MKRWEMMHLPEETNAVRERPRSFQCTGKDTATTWRLEFSSYFFFLFLQPYTHHTGERGWKIQSIALSACVPHTHTHVHKHARAHTLANTPWKRQTLCFAGNTIERRNAAAMETKHLSPRKLHHQSALLRPPPSVTSVPSLHPDYPHSTRRTVHHSTIQRFFTDAKGNRTQHNPAARKHVVGKKPKRDSLRLENPGASTTSCKVNADCHACVYVCVCARLRECESEQENEIHAWAACARVSENDSFCGFHHTQARTKYFTQEMAARGLVVVHVPNFRSAMNLPLVVMSSGVATLHFSFCWLVSHFPPTSSGGVN